MMDSPVDDLTALNDAIRLATLAEAAAMIAHEVNQPLSAITNFTAAANNLLRQMPSPPSREVLEFIERAGSEARRGGQIIRQLRQRISRVQFSRTTQLLEPIIAGAVELADVRHPGLRQVVQRQAPAGQSTTVLADSAQLQQLLIHLLDNAWEATSAQHGLEPVIRLEIESYSDEVRIAVIDNGPSMSEGDLLFEPFTSTKAGHLGMGLTIAKTIASAHGGRLWHESDAPTETAFVVAIPRTATTE